MLRGIDSESIDLIATDPPFNKGVKAFEGIVTAGVDKRGRKVQYKDVWTWGDVQAEWTESIRQDHPNLYAVIQGANAGGLCSKSPKWRLFLEQKRRLFQKSDSSLALT